MMCFHAFIPRSVGMPEFITVNFLFLANDAPDLLTSLCPIFVPRHSFLIFGTAVGWEGADGTHSPFWFVSENIFSNRNIIFNQNYCVVWSRPVCRNIMA